MRNLYRSLGLTIFAVLPAHAQLPPPPADAPSTPAPRIFVEKRSLDLGEVDDGDKVPLAWRIENRGAAPLIIDRTQSSCGCTVVQLTENEKTIPPGGALDLKAEFDSTRRPGDQAKSVIVYSNDPLEPALTVDFKAKVITLFTINPPDLVNLRVLQRGEKASQTLDVTPGPGKKTVELLKLELPPDASLTFAVEPLGEGGKRVVFTLPEDAAVGRLETTAQLTVRVDGLQRERRLFLRGEVVGDLTWLPRQLGDPRITSQPGKKFAPLLVQSPNKTPFEILSVHAGPHVDTTVEPVERALAQTEYRVHVALADNAPPGPFAATVQVRTSSLDQPLIEVPLFAIVAPPVTVDPPLVLLRPDGTPKGTQRRVKFMVLPKDSLELREVSCDHSAVRAELDPRASAGYRHLGYVNVTLAGSLPKGRHEATLTVHTNIPGAAELRIPVVIDAPG